MRASAAASHADLRTTPLSLRLIYCYDTSLFADMLILIARHADTPTICHAADDTSAIDVCR